MKNQHVKANLDNRYDDGRTFRQKMAEDKNRMSAGSIYKCCHPLLDAEVLQLAEEKEQQMLNARDARRATLISEFETRKAAAIAVMQKNLPFEQMKNGELKAVVQYKKRKGDKAVPTTKQELRNRYRETVDRSDQILDTYLLELGHSAAAAAADPVPVLVP